ncbi:hypothetical protein E4T56_gene10634 [Termitomyces sp. T112]|nr:hypothetical protein E4T56_gene10634 [Termitomyces sp. T112]
MSPRGVSSHPSSSKATPYSRRPTGQPKSSRQQFSACGACRMRRVRCDLKDLPFTAVGPHPSCSNCKERGLKCVDEFADVKAVKLLRRGRRLQQVEAIYGKVVGPDGAANGFPPSTRLPSIIPQLSPEFFVSPFWNWFSVQRPALDSAEFSARYIAHTKGVQPLGHEGGLLAMILVVWAASFGLDERGLPDASDDARDSSDLETPTATSHRTSSKKSSSHQDLKSKEPHYERTRKDRKETTDAMLREVLELIDFHGVMRRPSWDGVRVLLLIIPLLEDSHPLERLAMYEATLSQARALCNLSGSSAGPAAPITPFPDTADDYVLRARIFWYAHMQEGFSTGMRGGRLVLDNDDYEAFQNTLPAYAFTSDNPAISMPPSPPESVRPLSSHSLLPQDNQSAAAAQVFLRTSQLFSLPLQLSTICRRVHSVLTGSKATRRAEEHGLIDAQGMREIWEDLDLCWKQFDSMRRNGSSDPESASLDQFVSAWQIYIFECHNIIRESLKQCMTKRSDSMFSGESPSRPSSHSSSSPYLSPHHLHVIATRKCLDLLPVVLRIIKFHLTQNDRGLFRWDAGLIRDGCFFAGFLSANAEGEFIGLDDDDQVRSRGHLLAEDAVAICLTALSEMRWGFSRSEERSETIRMIWENRKVSRNTGRYGLGRNSYPDTTYKKPVAPIQAAPYTAHGYPTMGDHDRPLLPPLRSPRRAESVPSTAYSSNGQGGSSWPSYTPPGTATSVATSAGTGVSISARSSPLFNGITSISYKGDIHEPFYHVPSDIDQFSFHAPTGPGMHDGQVLGNGHYHHREPPSSAHSLHSTSSSTYLDPGVFSGPGSSMVHQGADPQSCPQFGDDCSGYYH